MANVLKPQYRPKHYTDQSVSTYPPFVIIQGMHVNPLYLMDFYWIDGKLKITLGDNESEYEFDDVYGDEYINLCHKLKLWPDADTVDKIERVE